MEDAWSNTTLINSCGGCVGPTEPGSGSACYNDREQGAAPGLEAIFCNICFSTRENGKKPSVVRVDFFRGTEIVAQELNLRFYLALPNILVGLGVLGTFAGLVFGIDNFDTQSVEGVRSSISVLLSGMSTAFYTSIAGMVCSIGF